MTRITIASGRRARGAGTVAATIVGGLFAASPAPAGIPIGTGFSYQGHLKQNGAPFTGTVNIDAALFNAETGGSLAGSILMFDGVVVTEGLFTLALDFGADALDGDRRWLELEVDGVTLSPRQPVQAAPYAVQTRGIFVNQSGWVGIGTTSPEGRLHVGPIGTGQSVILPGLRLERVFGGYNVLAGDNQINGSLGTIGGGADNYVASDRGTVGGGYSNTAGAQGTVAGGENNYASLYGTVAGGLNNTASAAYAVVCGGRDNRVEGVNAARGFIGGGRDNLVTGVEATIGGGVGNIASGPVSAIPGGAANEAAGGSSFAAGSYARALHDDTFVWSDGGISGFASTAERQFLVKAGGGVGINTNSPDTTVHVVGGTDAGPTGGGYIQAGNTNGANVVIDENEIIGRNNGSMSALFLQQDGGSLIIGGNSASTIKVGINTNAPGTFELALAGDAGKPGGGSWASFSDARLKEDIADLDGALDRLLALRGRTFRYARPGHFSYVPGEQIGFVAQEVEEIFPHWIGEDADGYRILSITGFEALAVEALRDLRREGDKAIEALRREQDERDAVIEALRRENDELRSRLAALETAMTDLLDTQRKER